MCVYVCSNFCFKIKNQFDIIKYASALRLQWFIVYSKKKIEKDDAELLNLNFFVSTGPTFSKHGT